MIKRCLHIFKSVLNEFASRNLYVLLVSPFANVLLSSMFSKVSPQHVVPYVIYCLKRLFASILADPLLVKTVWARSVQQWEVPSLDGFCPFWIGVDGISFKGIPGDKPGRNTESRGEKNHWRDIKERRKRDFFLLRQRDSQVTKKWRFEPQKSLLSPVKSHFLVKIRDIFSLSL